MANNNLDGLIELMSKNSVSSFNVIQSIIKQILVFSHVESIIYCQQLISHLLLYCVIINDTPKLDDKHINLSHLSIKEYYNWVDLFKKTIQKNPISINKTTYNEFVELKNSLLLLEKLTNSIMLIQKQYDQKINHVFEITGNNIWSTTLRWIKRKFDRIPETTSSSNPKIIELHQLFLDYKSSSESELVNKLNKNIKDFLHSKVNQTIIISRIKSKDGWKQSLKKPSSGLPNIRSIEKEIHQQLNKIVSPFDAPFIKSFYSELYSRCYKQLLSKDSTRDNLNSINLETKPDINEKVIKKNTSLPSDLQLAIDTEYLNFLSEICKNEINVKLYIRSNFSSFKAINNYPGISKNQKIYIQDLYLSIYNSVRHYEHILKELKKEISSINLSDTNTLIEFFINSIQILIHEYRPYLLKYVDLLTSFLVKESIISKRKHYINEYEKMISKLHSINQIIESFRLIQNKISKETSLNWLLSNNISKFISTHKKQFLNCFKIWDDHTLVNLNLKFAHLILEVLQLNIQFKSNRIIDPPYKSKSTISSIIDKEPKKTIDSIGKIINYQ